MTESTESSKRLMSMLRTAMGKDIERYLKDSNVVEIMLNPDGKLFIDKQGEGRSDTGVVILPANAQRIIEIVAGAVEKECHKDEPILSATLPETGERFQGWLPPVVKKPTFAIRKRAERLYTLSEYVASEIMTEQQKMLIEKAVYDRKNILVVGGTGTGKTTLCNAILAVIAETNDRVAIIEDIEELQCAAADKFSLLANKEITMNILLQGTMRMRPDRICVGEVTDGAALTMLKAWNTGHPGGVCTVHANSAYGGLIRVEQLIQEKSQTPQRELIAEAVNVIVYIKRHNNGRKVEEIVQVAGLENGKYILKNCA